MSNWLIVYTSSILTVQSCDRTIWGEWGGSPTHTQSLLPTHRPCNCLLPSLSWGSSPPDLMEILNFCGQHPTNTVWFCQTVPMGSVGFAKSFLSSTQSPPESYIEATQVAMKGDICLIALLLMRTIKQAMSDRWWVQRASSSPSQGLHRSLCTECSMGHAKWWHFPLLAVKKLNYCLSVPIYFPAKLPWRKKI